jgi:hypothetical protein
MAGEISGTDVLLLAKTGSGPDVYTVIGSQNGVKFDEKNAGVKIKSKLSHAATYLGGEYSCTATLDTLYVPSDVALVLLKAAVRAGTLVTVQRKESGAVIEHADALVSGNAEDFKDEAPATVSVSLTVSGVWVAGA